MKKKVSFQLNENGLEKNENESEDPCISCILRSMSLKVERSVRNFERS